MNNQLVQKILLISTLFFCFFLSFEKVLAGKEHAISGWAWSENIGWISFNCHNDYNGDGVLEDRCVSSNYGVHFDFSTKKFSGYAWSENVGWITFNERELSGCPQSPCQVWLGTDNKVYGWARALAYGGGWDGWIRLSGTTSAGTPYGITLNTSTNEFEGWAWSDMVIGWVSFNCKNQNVCARSNYKVFLKTPSATPSSESFQYCGVYAGQGKMNLSWKYEDLSNANQSAYALEVQQFIGNSWQTKVLCEEVPTIGPSSGGIGTSAVLIKSNPSSNLCDYPNYVGDIEYNKPTRWRVKVKNAYGIWSNWTEWTQPTSTAPHAYPWVDFTWQPQKPTAGQVVQFVNYSQCYDSLETTTCSNLTGDSFFWTFEGGSPNTSTLKDPTTTFSTVGSHSITLKVTDSDGYFCEKTLGLTSIYPFPFWKEIPPIFFKLKNFLASLISTLKNKI